MRGTLRPLASGDLPLRYRCDCQKIELRSLRSMLPCLQKAVSGAPGGDDIVSADADGGITVFSGTLSPCLGVPPYRFAPSRSWEDWGIHPCFNPVVSPDIHPCSDTQIIVRLSTHHSITALAVAEDLRTPARLRALLLAPVMCVRHHGDQKRASTHRKTRITSTSHPHHIRITSTSHSHHIHITSISHPHHIHITSRTHPPSRDSNHFRRRHGWRGVRLWRR